MLPVIIFVVVAIPLLLIAVFVRRQSTRAGEHPPTETPSERERTEHEFEDAERYQEEWREQHHEELRNERLP